MNSEDKSRAAAETADDESRRPWGYYQVLADEPTFKSKKIVVYPGKRLSLQRHRFRAEHWHIVAGRGTVTINGNTVDLATGQSADIPCGALHRIENTGETDLVFIEVQTGTSFSEDDIERLEDDFGRV